MPSLETLLDEAAYRHLAVQYALGADRRDKAVWAALMTQDIALIVRDRHTEGLANVLPLLDGLAATYEITQHRVFNQVLTVDDDTATGETYGIADHVKADDGGQTLIRWAVRYQDRLRRDGQGWRFSERRLIIDWVEKHSVTRQRT
ncbi:nuclear transport factor 2 family protein [Azospirillum soli]|uniref:nuclear transport factor 2 family protein n=1 Tax=Azospirillum soli TaxID=1304799 RepID=UPI001AE1C997|nr:nuclear transport factor 2 family protein [Azospirillum soli]MBP2316611.1 hypothetical protein [Azospirillum soli]